VSRPLAVAITGGIGAGKSEALAAFARHGAATVSSDQIVHRLLREDSGVREALVDHFGEGILDHTRPVPQLREQIGDYLRAVAGDDQSLRLVAKPVVERARLEGDRGDVCLGMSGTTAC